MKSSFPIRAVLVGLSWIIFQSATASYIHGNSLGQLIANHLPLGGLFFLTLLVLIVNPLIHKINALMIFSVSELVIIWIICCPWRPVKIFIRLFISFYRCISHLSHN